MHLYSRSSKLNVQSFSVYLIELVYREYEKEHHGSVAAPMAVSVKITFSEVFRTILTQLLFLLY
jgi:hypothetical protein